MAVPQIALASGLITSKLGFGGMGLTHVYGDPADEATALRVLAQALEEGITLIDTADVYGKPRPGQRGPAGTNEEVIGLFLKQHRSRVQVATKFGVTGTAPGEPAARGDRAYVRAACEASLRRLGTDVIDLYYLHRRDLSRPIAETVAAMAELVAEGKVRHLGLSEVTAAELREAASVHPIAAVQSEWSIWSRDVEDHVVAAAADVGAGFVPYSPLGRGFLAGLMTPEQVAGSVRAGSNRFSEYFDANQAVVEVIREVAGRHEATPAQVALAWLYAQGTRFGLPVVPIPGTRRLERVRENAAAVALTLSGDDLALLDKARRLVRGDRNITTDKSWISSGRE